MSDFLETIRFYGEHFADDPQALWENITDRFADLEDVPDDLDAALARADAALAGRPAEARVLEIGSCRPGQHAGLSLYRRLSLIDDMSLADIRRLVVHPGLHAIEHLTVDCPVDADGLALLLEAPLHPSATLKLGYIDITDAGMGVLAASERLDRVDLSDLEPPAERGEGWMQFAMKHVLDDSLRAVVFRRLAEAEQRAIADRERLPGRLSDGLEGRAHVARIAACSARLEAAGLPMVPVTLLLPYAASPDEVPRDRLFGPPPAGEWPRSPAVVAMAERCGASCSDDRMDAVLTLQLDDEQLALWVSLAYANEACGLEARDHHLLRIAPAAASSDEPLPEDLVDGDGERLPRRHTVIGIRRREVRVPEEVFRWRCWSEPVADWDEVHRCTAGGTPLAEPILTTLQTLWASMLHASYLGGRPLWLQGEHDTPGFIGQFREDLSAGQLNMGTGTMYLFASGAFWQC